MVKLTRIKSALVVNFWNITFNRCQVVSRVIAWFRDPAGDIDCYQMRLSQLESTSLHESKIIL